MLRKTGFYYVKRCDCWEVALYMLNNKGWSVPGFAGVFQDNEFSEIKEGPVKLPER